MHKLGCFIFWVCFVSSGLYSQTCFDSIHISTKAVQCYSFRNGSITIDSVYGGKWPFYFSLDGSTFSTRPVFDRLRAGTYLLTIRGDDGCEDSLSVLVEEPPRLVVKLSSSQPRVKRGESFTLEASVSPPDAEIIGIEWRPPALFSDQQSWTQHVEISETTVFAIEIIQKDSCTARAQVEVVADLADLYFPNVIEMGSNENAYFTVFAGKGVSKVKMLRIYSRDGANVFERLDFEPNNPLLGWGGFWRGKRLQPAVFTWVAVIEYADQSLEEFSGTVTLLR